MRGVAVDEDGGDFESREGRVEERVGAGVGVGTGAGGAEDGVVASVAGGRATEGGRGLVTTWPTPVGGVLVGRVAAGALVGGCGFPPPLTGAPSIARPEGAPIASGRAMLGAPPGSGFWGSEREIGVGEISLRPSPRSSRAGMGSGVAPGTGFRSGMTALVAGAVLVEAAEMAGAAGAGGASAARARGTTSSAAMARAVARRADRERQSRRGIIFLSA